MADEDFTAFARMLHDALVWRVREATLLHMHRSQAGVRQSPDQRRWKIGVEK